MKLQGEVSTISMGQDGQFVVKDGVCVAGVTTPSTADDQLATKQQTTVLDNSAGTVIHQTAAQSDVQEDDLTDSAAEEEEAEEEDVKVKLDPDSSQIGGTVASATATATDPNTVGDVVGEMPEKFASGSKVKIVEGGIEYELKIVANDDNDDEDEDEEGVVDNVGRGEGVSGDVGGELQHQALVDQHTHHHQGMLEDGGLQMEVVEGQHLGGLDGGAMGGAVGGEEDVEEGKHHSSSTQTLYTTGMLVLLVVIV